MSFRIYSDIGVNNKNKNTYNNSISSNSLCLQIGQVFGVTANRSSYIYLYLSMSIPELVIKMIYINEEFKASKDDYQK